MRTATDKIDTMGELSKVFEDPVFAQEMYNIADECIRQYTFLLANYDYKESLVGKSYARRKIEQFKKWREIMAKLF